MTDAAHLQVRHDAPDALATLSLGLERELVALGARTRPVVFACVGTDRSTGDSLGPLVGERLRRLGHDEHSVIGTLEHPLHALNLAERVTPIIHGRPRSLIVAVDAALGSLDAVGTVRVRRGGLRPGEGVGKDLPPIGELAIAATVNVRAGMLDAQVLQSTRLYLVQCLAELVANACWWSVRSIRRAERTGRAESTAPSLERVA